MTNQKAEAGSAATEPANKQTQPTNERDQVMPAPEVYQPPEPTSDPSHVDFMWWTEVDR